MVLTPTASAGGNTLYSSTDPGFDQLLAPAGGLFPLPDGVPVRIRLVSSDAGASVKVGSTMLDAPGEQALLGTTPGVHVHPVWQLVLPDGTVAARQLRFQLTTTAGGFATSAAYGLTLANPVPTTTTSVPATTTSTSPGAPTTSVAGSTTTSQSIPASTTTTTMRPAVQDQRLSGRLLRLSARGGTAAKQHLVVVSTGTRRWHSATDPIPRSWARRCASQVPGLEHTWRLPAVGWRRLGKGEAVKGWAYADRRRVLGPIASLQLKPGKHLRAAGSGAGLALDLTADPGPVAVVLEIGGQRWCLRFGGSVAFTPGREWKAKDAGPPAECAP